MITSPGKILSGKSGTSLWSSAEQPGRLIKMRLGEQPDLALIAQRHLQIRGRMAAIKLQLDVLDRSKDETPVLVVNVF